MRSRLLTRILTAFSPLPQARLVERFMVALVVALVAILLRGLLDPVLGHVAFYVTVYMAVAFCALLCGLAPAVLSATIGFLGVLYWFVDPRYSLTVSRQSEMHGIVGFFLVSAALIALGDATRRKQLQLDDTVVALRKEAGEREKAEEELRRAHDQLEERVRQRTVELSQALARLESEIEVRKETEEQLRHLSVRLMTLQDEERRRIARELHDTTGQTLVALKITIGSVQQLTMNTPGLPPLIDDLNAFADEALREIRTTSYLLHPPLLDEAGFASAARWFVEGFAKRSQIQVQLEISEPLERLSRECELVLFRVLQESLTNVHRHSRASAAGVKLTMDAGQAHLEVSDNGRGIDELRVQQFQKSNGSVGVGIAGMRERVRQLGGTLDISSDQSGTTVRVDLPVTKTSESQVSVGVPAA
jgi:signal transduction histidine kinase